MENRDVAIQISGLVKRYRLGVIGGGTLQGDIMSWRARRHGKEDPNLIIGQNASKKNAAFLALNGVDLIVYKGERLGIIGHNGAGKSTLLKLLSRVTAPTEGNIRIDGRMSSMLEVGTGFSGELTGRENIYLNGAILGMSTLEVNRKIDQIIEFSECGMFIDTPVKRYSSGMYVKLAFAVAAHLDSEILVMDEVLAVGDMKFQQKCLGKMNEVSQEDGRTVLYVSHNMNTIRQLCNRCIVMDHGKVIFNGDVEEAINMYTQESGVKLSNDIDLQDAPRLYALWGFRIASFSHLRLLGTKDCEYKSSDILEVELSWEASEEIEQTCVRFEFKNAHRGAIASAVVIDFCKTEIHENTHTFELPLCHLMEGIYSVTLVLFTKNEFGTGKDIDTIRSAFSIVILPGSLSWNSVHWGYVRLPDLICRS